jgi:DNA (cytosine-5)-methyltransferase 1
MPTVVDLFCGCGGLSAGLQQAGFTILAGVDNDPKVLQTFALNHPDAQPICQDLTQLSPQELMKTLEISIGELDCLVGGPPCQGFSKNVPASYRFLDDERNLLFRDFLTFVEVIKPKTILMENVAEIYNAYEGKVRTEIVNRLEELGYQVRVDVVYAPDYGVPQKRRRCFIFATCSDLSCPVLPSPTHLENPVSAWQAISDLPILYDGEGSEPMNYTQEPTHPYQMMMRNPQKVIYDHITRKLQPLQFERVSALRAGQGMADLPAHLRPKSGYSGAYGRLDFEALAPTITRWVFHSGSGRFCHPREPRLITIREAARLQSFQDNFRFIGTYIEKAHQVGNAVPPLLTLNYGKTIQMILADLEVPVAQYP